MKKHIIRELVDERSIKEGSFRLGFLLALSIGVLNACTWLNRGHVFASSQSGNLLYLGLDLSMGKFDSLLKYIFPPLMYAAGILFAERFRDDPDIVHWKRYPFFLEIGIVAAATFMPLSWNALANPIFGLACGLQTITFRHIRDVPVATVVINGSFQNALVHGSRWFHFKEDPDQFRMVLYTAIVLAYLLGIIVGGFLSQWMHQYVSLVSVGILSVCAWYLMHNTEDSD